MLPFATLSKILKQEERIRVDVCQQRFPIPDEKEKEKGTQSGDELRGMSHSISRGQFSGNWQDGVVQRTVNLIEYDERLFSNRMGQWDDTKKESIDAIYDILDRPIMDSPSMYIDVRLTYIMYEYYDGRFTIETMSHSRRILHQVLEFDNRLHF